MKIFGVISWNLLVGKRPIGRVNKGALGPGSYEK